MQAILARPQISSAINKQQYDKDYNDPLTERQLFDNRILFESLKFAGVPSIITAKLDANQNVVSNKLASFSGTDRHDLMFMIYKLSS